jgi:hypothetical protein
MELEQLTPEMLASFQLTHTCYHVCFTKPRASGFTKQ